MNGLAAALVALAMIALPLGIATTASAETSPARDLTPIVIGPQTTDRFGGGDVVAVKAGDALFGVRYGTENHTNDIVVFAEYPRFLGAADVVDNQGRYLATRGIPVVTVIAQSLDRFIEFQRVNDTAGYDLRSPDNATIVPVNEPVKALRLTTAWTLSGLTSSTVDNVTTVDFTVSAMDLPYTWVHNATGLGDGVLNEVAFTFHLRVDARTVHAQVPWFQVSVDDGNQREITHVEFLELRNVTGRAVFLGAKYDHLIQGWDFASPNSRLALETRLLFGNFVPDRTADFIHKLLVREHADDGADFERDADHVNATERPRLLTRDRVYLDDNWTRVGAFRWVSDVTVDGEAMRMAFQVQGGGRLFYEHAGAAFTGFWLRGAYVYPAGQTIAHDPSLEASSFLALPSGLNLTPVTVLAIQLGVVGAALVPAVYLHRRSRRQA